jgi:vancomycin resistance protein YoaR
VVEPRAGRAIDPQQAQEAITAAYLSEDRTAHLDLVPSAPTIDDADVQAAVRDFANPAMSGSVALDLAHEHVVLQPRDFAAALSMRAVGGRLVPHVRAGLLARLVRDAMPGGGKAVDASVALVGGRPHVAPDRPGVTFERTAAAAAFTAALTLPEGQRVAPVAVELHDPEFTTEDAQHLGIEHRVAVYETTYPSRAGGSDLSGATSALNGTLLMPGDTFSWAAVAGTGDGPDAMPVATALFNAAYEAGFGDVEHHAPATFAGPAPAGRQATVDGGADLRFSVDSPYGVLISVKSTASAPGQPGTVKVVLWSTVAWEVTVSTSARYGVVEPAVREDADPGCVASPGRKGFSVDLSRHLHNLADPTADRDETVTTTYAPVDAVVCTPPTGG